MFNREAILKYIDNEIEISNYKISTIERCSSISPSKRRILEIEKEFVNLPLKDMDFKDVADVAAAISIYRSSRGLFYKTYKIERPGSTYESKAELLKQVEDRIEFIKNTILDFSNKRIQEVNLVQNDILYKELIEVEAAKNSSFFEKEERRLNKLTLDELLELEPIAIAKKRARIQSALCSIGIYLSKSLTKVIYNQENIDSLRYAIIQLDNIIYEIKDNVFQNYNMAIDYLKDKELGMGKNPYSGKIHTLQNILDFKNNSKAQYPRLIKDSLNFNSHIPQVGNINFGVKLPIYATIDDDKDKQTRNKVYGIIFPIPRKGNEKLTLLYKDIKIRNKNVNNIFCNSLSNVKAKNNDRELEYFKAILIKPLWEILDVFKEDEDVNKIMSRVTRVKNIKNANLNNKTLIKKINSITPNFLPIDDDSKILTAKTRSEEDGISEIIPIIDNKVNEIIQDYQLCFGTTNDMSLN